MFNASRGLRRCILKLFLQVIRPTDPASSYSIFTPLCPTWMTARLRLRSVQGICSHQCSMVSFYQPIPQTPSYTVNPFVGMYCAVFATSIFYLTKKRHTSWNTVTKLITFVNVFIFLLATAVSTQRIFPVPALSAGIWV